MHELELSMVAGITCVSYNLERNSQKVVGE